MRETQKIIKYCAIAFALFLIVSIISGLMYGATFIGGLFDENVEITEKLEGLEIGENTSLLVVDIASSNIIIKTGDTLKVETNNKYINSKEENNKLYITEKKHNWINNKNSDLIIYVPINFVFDGVSITTGAGKVNIDTLSAKQLDLELGAGRVDINELRVIDNTKIEGGAGAVTIKNGNMNNLDLDMGVGSLSLTSKLTGNNKIDSGVGQMSLNLLGSLNDYEITLDKGLGSATIDGKKMENDTVYGTGINELDIDGGVGSIYINFIG